MNWRHWFILFWPRDWAEWLVVVSLPTSIVALILSIIAASGCRTLQPMPGYSPPARVMYQDMNGKWHVIEYERTVTPQKEKKERHGSPQKTTKAA